MHWFGSFIVGAKRRYPGKGCRRSGCSTRSVKRRHHRVAPGTVGAGHPAEVRFRRARTRRSTSLTSGGSCISGPARPARPHPSLEEIFSRHATMTPTSASQSRPGRAASPRIENTHKIGAIGVPGFNWETRIVDENGRDVPRASPENCSSGVTAS